MVVSTSVLLEYEEMITQKTSAAVSRNILSLIAEAVNTQYVTIYYEWNAIRMDPDDNKCFDTAVAANADYIVTYDRHFNEVKHLSFPSIQVVSGEEFRSMLLRE